MYSNLLVKYAWVLWGYTVYIVNNEYIIFFNKYKHTDRHYYYSFIISLT